MSAPTRPDLEAIEAEYDAAYYDDILHMIPDLCAWIRFVEGELWKAQTPNLTDLRIASPEARPE